MKNVIVKVYANGNAVASKTITSTIQKNKDAQTTLEWTTDTAGTYTMKVTATYGTETAKELTLTQKVTVAEKGGVVDLMSWLPWIVVVLLIFVVIGVAIAMGRRARPGPAPPAVRAPAPRPALAPARRPAAEEEDEEEEEAEKAAAPKPLAPPTPAAAAAKPKIARIKCPKCQTIKDVTSPVRPIEVKCDNCGARLRLVK
jgi:hypothetical protein